MLYPALEARCHHVAKSTIGLSRVIDSDGTETLSLVVASPCDDLKKPTTPRRVGGTLFVELTHTSERATGGNNERKFTLLRGNLTGLRCVVVSAAEVVEEEYRVVEHVLIAPNAADSPSPPPTSGGRRAPRQSRTVRWPVLVSRHLRLVHGAGAPETRWPLRSEPRRSSIVVLGDRPRCRAIWDALPADTRYRVREVDPSVPVEIEGAWSSALAVGAPVFGSASDGHAGSEPVDGVVEYVLGSPAAVGRNEVRLAWTTEEGGQETVRALTRHVVHVLPAHPVGQWLTLAPSVALLDAVCVRAEGAATPVAALERLLTSIWKAPGSISYDPSGDELAAPDMAEVDAYLDSTASNPIPLNDAGGLIEDLALWLLGGGTRPPVKVVCHPLAHLVMLAAQLLGIHAEARILGGGRSMAFLAPCRALGTGQELGGPFAQHSLTVLPLEGEPGDPLVAEICFAPTERSPMVMPLSEYARILDVAGAGFERRSPQLSRPLVFAGEDERSVLAKVRERAEELCEAIENSRPDGNPRLRRVYVGRGQPGWARAEWASRGMRCAMAFRVATDLPAPSSPDRSDIVGTVATLSAAATVAQAPRGWVKGNTRRLGP